MSEFLQGNIRSVVESIDPGVEAQTDCTSSDDVKSIIDESQYLAELAALETERDAVKSNASKQWTSIFTPKNAPLCDTHGLPCIELVTKKSGPNLGRKFWICSKPVGPGYDNGKRLTPY
jgi:AP endonuclease 2